MDRVYSEGEIYNTALCIFRASALFRSRQTFPGFGRPGLFISRPLNCLYTSTAGPTTGISVGRIIELKRAHPWRLRRNRSRLLGLNSPNSLIAGITESTLGAYDRVVI